MVVFCIPCLVLFLIVSVIAMFFPRYKPFIKESWRCFWDKLRMRPCEMEFDKKVKTKMVSKLIKRDKPKLANFVNKYFDLSLIVLGIFMIVVMVYLTYLSVDWILLGNKPCNNGTCEI